MLSSDQVTNVKASELEAVIPTPLCGGFIKT